MAGQTHKNGTRRTKPTAPIQTVDVEQTPAVLVLATGELQLLNGINPDSVPTLLRRLAAVVERQLGA